MAKKENPGLPQPEDTAAGAASPKPSAIHNFPVAPEVELNVRPKRPVQPRLKSYLWLTGPAWADFHKKVDVMLAENARERDLEIAEEVPRIRLARIAGETIVYMFATTENDEDGIEMKRAKSKQYANLADFMVPRGLHIPTGQARRFDVISVGEDESPVGPALRFDTAKPLEQKNVRRKKTDEEVAEDKAVEAAKAKARAEAKARVEAVAKAKAEAKAAARAAAEGDEPSDAEEEDQ